jgi:DNA-binding transcriptional ArsR family regulator
MDNQELAELNKALSVPVRLNILQLISERPLCVNAITHFLGISQPAVSQHLAVLRRAGLAKGEKSGYKVHYALNRDRLEQLRKAMEQFAEPRLPPTDVSGRKAPAGTAAGPDEAHQEPEHGNAKKTRITV